MYDFVTVVDRKDSGSIKTDFAPEPVKGSGFVPLTIADMEFRVCPEITEAIKVAADHGIYGYTYADNKYMNSVKNWMASRHNWTIEDDWLITTNGVVPALGIAVRAFTEPGDSVIIQPPVYPPFARSIIDNGRKIVSNPLICKDGHYEMDFEDLESKASRDDVKLILLCSPHNPVGRVWSFDELSRLADICKRHGVVVISDEIHNDLILDNNTHTVFANVPSGLENCVVCTAVSKTFNLAGLSCSNIFIPAPELRKKFAFQASISSGGCVPFFAKAATVAAYDRAGCWLDELLHHVEDNFKFMYDFVAERLPMLSVIRAEGTYLAWVDMRSLGLSNEDLEHLMLETGFLALDEGYIFGSEGSGFERWNLALPSSLLQNALLRLEKAVLSVTK